MYDRQGLLDAIEQAGVERSALGDDRLYGLDWPARLALDGLAAEFVMLVRGGRWGNSLSIAESRLLVEPFRKHAPRLRKVARCWATFRNIEPDTAHALTLRS